MTAGAVRVAWRILVARLVALIPLAAALALGAVRVVAATYDELVVPSDTATPIVVRVVRAAPEVILVAVAAWILGEILGAVAASADRLDDDRVGGALRAVAVRVGPAPAGGTGRFLLPTVALALVLVPTAIATGSAWEALGGALRSEATR